MKFYLKSSIIVEYVWGLLIDSQAYVIGQQECFCGYSIRFLQTTYLFSQEFKTDLATFIC